MKEWYATKELVVNPDFVPIDGIFFVFDNTHYIQIREDGLFNVLIGNQEQQFKTLLNAANWLWETFARHEYS